MHSVQFYVWHTALLNNATITVAMARIGALIGLFKVHVVTFYMCRQGQLGYIFCAFSEFGIPDIIKIGAL